MRQFIAILVFLLATIVAADPLDDAIALMRRQNNETTSSIIPSSTPEPSSQTPIQETSTSTFTQAPSVSTFTSFSTITPTNSEGTATASAFTSAFTSAVTSQASFTQIESSVTQETIITFTTTSDGSAIVATRTSSTVVPTTTEVDPATLRDGGKSGGSSGLSSSTKATIGGVVGGIGGALLLGALAYTGWRIWGKKKNLHDDDLYDPNVHQEKLSTSTDTQNTPFRNNLEQYHQPGPVNTASNF